MPIFLSYSRDNEETVKALAVGFQAAERQVWYDNDLGGGDAWWDTILDNIRLADVFLFALSDSSLHSKACMAELNYALALGRPIVPVQVGEVRNFVANPLAKLQILPFSPDSATSAFKIIAAIDQASRKMRPLPDPLPPEPPIPFAYLLKLREQIDSTQDLDQVNQTAVVDQLARALSDETDPSIIATILNMLDNIKSKPWCTKRTERRIRLIIEEYTASTSGISEAPRGTKAEPGTTTAEPGTTKAEPGTTKAEPGTTTAEPETTTAEPGTTTAEPGTTKAATESATSEETTRSEPPGASSQTWTWPGPESAGHPPPEPATDPYAIFAARMEAFGHRPTTETHWPTSGPSAPEATVPVWPLAPEAEAPEREFDFSAPRTDNAAAPIWMGVARPLDPPQAGSAAPAPSWPASDSAASAASPTEPWGQSAAAPAMPTAQAAPVDPGVPPPVGPAPAVPAPHWVRSILAIALMPVFGVVAFVFAVKVDRRLAEGDLVAAREAANTSRTWAVVAIVVGGLHWALYPITGV